MVDRLKSALDGRTDEHFVIMARTDAHAVEGFDAALERATRYVEAGADMIFAEALTSLDEYRRFTSRLTVPVLANITEFGKTPLFTVEELASAGVGLVLYPLSAFRAMSRAAKSATRPFAVKARNTVSWIECRRELSCTTFSTITRTSKSWIVCSARNLKERRWRKH